MNFGPLTSFGFGASGSGGGGGTVTSVSGTTDRITVTGTTAVVVDIAATYIGQGSITTTGTVQTGVWNSTYLPNINTQPGSYVLVLGDQSKIVQMNVAGANNVTVPPNASVAFPIGTQITIVQQGAGLTSVVAGAGVTINTSSGVLTSPGQNSPMILEKSATNTWYLWNGIAGFVNPMTTQGDIIVASVAGAPARFAIGAAFQMLKVNAGATGLQYISFNNGQVMYWDTASGLASDTGLFWKTSGQRLGVGDNASLPTSRIDITTNGLGVTPSSTAGLSVNNIVAAVNGTQQYSPPVKLTSFGFGTTAGTSQECSWRMYVAPVQGATPAGNLIFDYSLAGGAFSTQVTFNPSLSLISAANINATTGFASNNFNRLNAAVMNYSADTGATTGHKFQYIAAAAQNATSGTFVLTQITAPFGAPSGNATLAAMQFSATVNMVGTATGAYTHIQISTVYTLARGDVFGVDYNPTVTSVLGVNYAWRNTSGVMMINGTTITASTLVDQRGLGTTSGTINNRWADSANAVLASLTDDGTYSLKHLAGVAGTPGIAAGTGAGTGPTVAISGTDLGGFISVTTGTAGATAATIVTITFNKAYAVTPKSVVITPANAVTAALNGTTQVYVIQANISTTIFAITSGTAALTDATAYQWYYHVIQ